MAKVLEFQLQHQAFQEYSEQTPGVGDGQGVLSCCSPWGRKELDTTEQLSPRLWPLEKTLERPLECKEIKPVNPKANQP